MMMTIIPQTLKRRKSLEKTQLKPADELNPQMNHGTVERKTQKPFR